MFNICIQLSEHIDYNQTMTLNSSIFFLGGHYQYPIFFVVESFNVIKLLDYLDYAGVILFQEGFMESLLSPCLSCLVAGVGNRQTYCGINSPVGLCSQQIVSPPVHTQSEPCPLPGLDFGAPIPK